jgi:hypothetical protein
MMNLRSTQALSPEREDAQTLQAPPSTQTLEPGNSGTQDESGTPDESGTLNESGFFEELGTLDPGNSVTRELENSGTQAKAILSVRGGSYLCFLGTCFLLPCFVFAYSCFSVTYTILKMVIWLFEDVMFFDLNK